MEIIASHDKKDSTSLKREDTDFTSALKEDVKGLRIGIPRDYFGDGLDGEVRAAELQSDRQPLLVFSAGNADPRKSRQIDGNRINIP